MPIARIRLAHVLCAMAGLLASLVWTSAASGASRDGCHDVVFIGARASGEPRAPFAGMGAAVDHMSGVLRRRLAEAGLTMRAEADPYPAEPTSDLYLFWRGRIGRYFRSIAEGARDAVALADDAVRACPAATLVLAGYSQGAMAIHQAELRMAAAHDPALARIGGTLLLGDGDRVFGTRARRFGSASAEAVGLRTYFLPGDGHDVTLAQSTADICNAGDLICDFRIRELAGTRAIRRAMSVHGAYAPRHGGGSFSPLLDAAAGWVAQRIVTGAGPLSIGFTGRTVVVAGIGARFSHWRAATGAPVTVADRLPEDLLPDRCVLLLVDGPFGAGDADRLADYLRRGGTVVAVGERADGGRFSRADAALNALSRRLGLGLALEDDAVDPDHAVSAIVVADPLTAGVQRVGYDWAATISVAGAARRLVATADGTGTLVGGEALGAGTFVLTGDSNLLTDDDAGAYAADDNGRLVRDLCGGR